MSGALQIVLMIVGIAALAALVWVFVEAALAVRRVRTVVSDLKDRIEPTISHIESLTESLQPTVDNLDPLVERATLTVDSLNLELMQLDKILSDAGDITGTANGAVQKISDVANAPSNLANNAANKIRGVFSKKKTENKVENAIDASAPVESEHTVTDEEAAEASRIVTEWAQEASAAAKAVKAEKAAAEGMGPAEEREAEVEKATEEIKAAAAEAAVGESTDEASDDTATVAAEKVSES